ncbi:hypothetical protein NZK35_29580 [Stieleria sp. ICT_E10.1]|nr:hypothetical protein [Stieleria sedimenti]
MTVMLIFAGGQLVSAGMMISCDERLAISAEGVAELAFGGDQDVPTFVRYCDSPDQAFGIVGNSVGNGSSSAVLSSSPVLPLHLSGSTIRFANAMLPPSPCLEGLFKPV